MPGPYSYDLRKKIVDTYKTENTSFKKLAIRFSIGISTVQRYINLSKEDPDLIPKTIHNGRARRIDAKGEEIIKEIIKKNPTITLLELAEEYYDKCNERVGSSVLSRTCSRIGLGFKKLSYYAKEQEREDVKKKEKTL